MPIKRIFNIRNRTGSRCLKCNKDINPNDWRDESKYVCPYCGQIHLVSKKGRVVKITVAERPELHHRSTLTKEEQLIKDKALLKIALKDLKRENEALQKENEKLKRKIDRLEGKENVFQDEHTEETDEECV